MSLLSEIFSAGTGGVITGLVGSVVTSIANYKSQKLKNEHEVRMIEAETKAMVAETNANIKITETKVQGELAKSENQIYAETIKQAGRKSLSNELLQRLYDSPWTRPFGVILSLLLGLVDFLKAFIRPGLTLYLVAVTTWITYTAYTILTIHEQFLSADQAYSLFISVVQIVIYLTVSCVTWWFGDRRTAKFLHRLNDGNFRK